MPSMRNKILFVLFCLALLAAVAACNKDPQPKPEDGVDLTGIPYSPTPYQLQLPPGFPSMNIPPDNPLTHEGIDLGRHLFFDPILSVDSTIACASCHDPKKSFADGAAVSTGVNGLQGTRSAMALINVGFFDNGLFWDGRSPSLEDQALHPVENPVEMADTWENVEKKLRRHPMYQEKFRKAFGIRNSNEITRELAVKAIAQFERILISSNSRFDRKFYQNDPDPFLFSDLETDGYFIFFDDLSNSPTAGHCAHCHDGGVLLSSNDYFNNGIENVSSLDDFPDKGRGAVTGKRSDNGKFRAPTLRNIELTAPYMHDGRFQTLEEVIEHYNSGGHFIDNVNAQSIQPLHLSEYDKKALIAFLKTLTDTSFINNPLFQNPFE